METSAVELARTREVLHELLDQLGLPIYRFDVQAAGDAWQIIVECETSDGWQRVRVQVRSDSFAQAGAGNRQVRSALASQLDRALCDCLRVV